MDGIIELLNDLGGDGVRDEVFFDGAGEPTDRFLQVRVCFCACLLGACWCQLGLGMHIYLSTLRTHTQLAHLY